MKLNGAESDDNRKAGWLLKELRELSASSAEGTMADKMYDEANYAAALQFIRSLQFINFDLLRLLLNDLEERNRALAIELLVAMEYLPKHRGRCTAPAMSCTAPLHSDGRHGSAVQWAAAS